MIKLKGGEASEFARTATKAVEKAFTEPSPLATQMSFPSTEKQTDQKSSKEDATIKSKTESKKKDDEDDIKFDEKDDDEILARIREQRVTEFKSKQKKEDVQTDGCGKYEEIVQDEFLPTVLKHKHCIVHFYHNSFERCRIVDKHMGLLCERHKQTKFVKINAEKTTFFATKLAIKMLPTVVIFIDGKAVDRIVGFDELGGQDDFTTAAFASRLSKSGVIKLAQTKLDKPKNSIRVSTLNDEVFDDTD
eukprot:TRINITY_DN3229_c0_g1_i1.p1 TRINITY_DN3229_c0_g1~~TRINITY_DN3229_c0_g1_i1.p1  ORF type:complete len:248 (-),score=59.67 TRINITY_DN3229_c0_g1_i1:239-982(-)